MARIAEAHGAGIFCVGLEFTYAQKFDARWRKIIAAVRQVYHGKLTYGEQLGQLPGGHLLGRARLHRRPGLFPLTKSVNPSQTEIAAAWDRNVAELLTLFESAWRQEILFVEIGYNVSARAAAEPWAFKWVAPTRTKSSSAASRWRSICRGAARPSPGCIGGNGSLNCRAARKKITGCKRPRSKP